MDFSSSNTRSAKNYRIFRGLCAEFDPLYKVMLHWHSIGRGGTSQCPIQEAANAKRKRDSAQPQARSASAIARSLKKVYRNGLAGRSASPTGRSQKNSPDAKKT